MTRQFKFISFTATLVTAFAVSANASIISVNIGNSTTHPPPLKSRKLQSPLTFVNPAASPPRILRAPSFRFGPNCSRLP